ncbi:tautomerase family protein [Halorientalis brevis]|uniref:Tautomerase family protein n=1 Tax=Halorientalis brevis TaxID=1126241 RepID=A0ABD6C968_9EURY|nr:tautomerase family protein [Halorientalis brevis]
MPLLQFETTVELSADEKRTFADAVRDLYGEIMQTGTSHAAVVVRPRSPGELSIGRGVPDEDYLFLDAEIRRGRSSETKRELALALMDLAAEEFEIPTPNMKVVFTEHEGANMMGYDRVGAEWDPSEGSE